MNLKELNEIIPLNLSLYSWMKADYAYSKELKILILEKNPLGADKEIFFLKQVKFGSLELSYIHFYVLQIQPQYKDRIQNEIESLKKSINHFSYTQLNPDQYSQ